MSLSITPTGLVAHQKPTRLQTKPFGQLHNKAVTSTAQHRLSCKLHNKGLKLLGTTPMHVKPSFMNAVPPTQATSSLLWRK
jgi:hypothetical protein